MLLTHSISPSAQAEYEKSIEWYLERSYLAGENFVKEIDETINSICKNPEFGKNYYGDFLEVSLKIYPFKIIYIIEKETFNIVILSFFHNKRDPKNKYSNLLDA